MAKVWLDIGMNYIPLTWLSSFCFISKIHLLMNNPPIMTPSGPSERSARGLPLACNKWALRLLRFYAAVVIQFGCSPWSWCEAALYPPNAQHPPYPEFMYYLVFMLQGSPDCLESACSVLNSLPPLWGFPGASLIAQLVKNLPAMCETLVWFLGQEDPLGKG